MKLTLEEIITNRDHLDYGLKQTNIAHGCCYQFNMARPLRIKFRGDLHHILSRGNEHCSGTLLT
jgi:hypothetical protein